MLRNVVTRFCLTRETKNGHFEARQYTVSVLGVADDGTLITTVTGSEVIATDGSHPALRQQLATLGLMPLARHRESDPRVLETWV